MSDKKILVADDEIHIRQVVAMKLRNNGFEVILAENGRQAYELACSEKPDVIVSDYQMPLMTGLEMIEALRKNSLTVSIPVIMLTARDFAIDEPTRQRLGIFQCLNKPFSPREVLGNVEQALSAAAAT